MKLTVLVYVLVIFLLLQVSCSRTGGTLSPPPPDPCSLMSVSLNGAVANPSAHGASDGTITMTATGGTSAYVFSINGGYFQSSNKFINLGAGTYKVTAKNADGCTGSITLFIADPPVSCSGVNIILSITTTYNILCEAPSAQMTITASGGVAPYQYSLDGGAFVTSNVLINLPTGSHVILVQDANGCTATASTTINNASAGPLFSQVRTLIRNNCLYCHGPSVANGGVNYSDDCSIVTGKLRIKARAVDANPTPMPPTGLLPASERQKIIDWINAGGRYVD